MKKDFTCNGKYLQSCFGRCLSFRESPNMRLSVVSIL